MTTQSDNESELYPGLDDLDRVFEANAQPAQAPDADTQPTADSATSQRVRPKFGRAVQDVVEPSIQSVYDGSDDAIDAAFAQNFGDNDPSELEAEVADQIENNEAAADATTARITLNATINHVAAITNDIATATDIDDLQENLALRSEVIEMGIESIHGVTRDRLADHFKEARAKLDKYLQDSVGAMRADQLANELYEQINKYNSINDIKNVLKTSTARDSAKDKVTAALDDKVFTQAQNQRTISDSKNYINAYASSKEVKEMMTTTFDEKVFNDTQNQRTISDSKNYINAYASSKEVKDLMIAALDLRVYRESKNHRSTTDAKNYMDAYASSPEIKDLMIASLDERVFRTAQNQRSPYDMLNQVRAYASSAIEREAMERVIKDKHGLS